MSQEDKVQLTRWGSLKKIPIPRKLGFTGIGNQQELQEMILCVNDDTLLSVL